MARSDQTARDPSDPPIRWMQREYLDHAGNRVVLGKLAAYECDFYRACDGGAYRLQIYSTTPIQPADFAKLYRYLCNELSETPFLEIYTYNPPEGLACAEHQRREIAHRKRRHQDESEDKETLPPLIPTMRLGFHDTFMSGFCFLLTSQSYLQASDGDQHGTGPWWISFDRSLPRALKEVDMVKRVESSGGHMRPFPQFDSAVNPEMMDINVDITTDQAGFGYDMKELMRGIFSTHVYGEIDYGLNEPAPPETLGYPGHPGNYSSSRKSCKSRHKTVAVTNNSSDGECDLQYVIYAQFLAGIKEDPAKTQALLETTARAFTSSIISHLASKTVYFEFRIPDSPAFIQEPGVLFYILWADPAGYIKPEGTSSVIETRRSAGVPETARRLAVLAIEEDIRDHHRRLTLKEYKALFPDICKRLADVYPILN